MSPQAPAPARSRPSAQGRSSAPETVRVAPREIKDVAYRALWVRGCSAGEASLAARAVVAAHLVADADGLAMLLDELPRVRSERVGARFLAEAVQVLVDEAHRGLFFAVPAGVERLLSDPATRAVLLPGLRWRPGADALVLVTAGEQGPGLVLEDVPAVAEGGPALLLRRREAPDGAAASSPAGAAESSGVEVDAEQWRAAIAAAEPYLVPET